MSSLKKIIPASLKKKVKKLLGLDQSIHIEQIARDIANRKLSSMLSQNQEKVLSGKTAVVTGSTGFIGKEIALRLCRSGATVYLGGRNEEKLLALQKEFEESGLQAVPLIFEITNEEQVKSAFDLAVSAHGTIDILVNCAGGSARDHWNFLHNQRKEVIDEIIDSNLKGTMLCCKWAAGHMINSHSGKIINISSTVGVGGKSGFCDYAAAKAGIIGLTKSLALELGQYGITVNCVTPGIVNRGSFTEQNIKEFQQKNALGSIGIANDIAYAVSFFATDEANFITGQNLIADGGRSLGLKGD